MARPDVILIFIIYLGIVWPDSIVYKYGSYPGVTPFRILSLVFLMAFLFQFIFYQSYRSRFIRHIRKYKDVIFPVITLFVAGVVAGIFTPFDEMMAIYGAFDDFLSYSIVFIYILLYIRDYRVLFRVVVFSIMTVNVFGLWELLVAKGPLFNSFLITENDFTMLNAKYRGGYRIMSVYNNSLVYSQLLLMSVPLFLSYFFVNRRLTFKFFAVVNLLVILILQQATYSRAGLLLTLVTPVIFFFLYMYKRLSDRSSRILFLWLFGFISIVVGYFFSIYLEKFFMIISYGDFLMFDSANARLLQYYRGMDYFLDNPFFGYGAYGSLQIMSTLRSIDNYYLSTLLDYGLVGFFSFLFFNFAFFNRIKHYLIYPSVAAVFLSIVLFLVFMIALSLDKMLLMYYVLIAYLLLYMRRLKVDINNSHTKLLF